jgi:hypothetical protein
MSPGPGELAALARKYALLAALRRAKAADGTVPERGVLKAIANHFPGALNELDTLTLNELDGRAAALAAAAESGPPEPWMAWIHGYHALLRASFAIKARALVEGVPSPERAASMASDVSRKAGVQIDAAFVEAVLRPAGGRVLPVVYARLAASHGIAADVIADALFPRRRARR